MAENPAAAINHGEGLRLPETSSRCITECAIHNFEVTNYALLEGLGVGRHVTSTTFSVGGYDWNIRFYPDGSKEKDDSALAFLFYFSSTKDVRAKFTFTLLEEGGKQHVLTSTDVVHRIFSPESVHYSVYVQKSRLRSSFHLHRGYLTLRCMLTVIKEPPRECRRNLIVVPPPELPGQLERALKNSRGADVTLLVGGVEFSAHKFMLAARSPVFDAQFFGPLMDKDTRCIEIVDIEPTIFEMLLHFIYVDSLPPSNENDDYDTTTMQHLLIAAYRYGLDRLKMMCEEKLWKSIDVKTVTSTLAVANRHYCERLKNECGEFMSAMRVKAALLLIKGFKCIMTN